MYQMIVSDMDGTLLGKNGLSERTAKTLLKATQMGIHFVVATGRDLSGVKNLFDRHHIPFQAILGNGAQYCDENGTLVLDAYLDKRLLSSILAILDELALAYMIFTTDGFYSTREPSDVAEAFIRRGMYRFHKTRDEVMQGWSDSPMPCLQLQQITDLSAFLAKPCELIKVEAFDIDENKVALAKQRLSGLTGISYLSSYPDNVEITDQLAQKGLILEKVVEKMGIAKTQVAVFGDGLNDRTLFERFPESYAVANAEEEIRQLAKYHIPSHDEDGVAQAIERFLIKEKISGKVKR